MSVPPDSVNPPPVAGGSSDDKTLALITHLSGIVLGFIVPLVIWLVNKDNPAKSYITDESKEALNFQITILIGYVISWVLMFIVIGFFLWFVVIIANLVFCILAAMSVSSKGSYRYPFALRLIK